MIRPTYYWTRNIFITQKSRIMDTTYQSINVYRLILDTRNKAAIKWVGIVGFVGKHCHNKQCCVTPPSCTCMKSFTHTHTQYSFYLLYATCAPWSASDIWSSLILFSRSPVFSWLRVVQWHGFLLSVCCCNHSHGDDIFPCSYIKTPVIRDV